MQKIWLAFAMMATAVLMCAGAASAITNGQPDGNQHPNLRLLHDQTLIARPMLLVAPVTSAVLLASLVPKWCSSRLSQPQARVRRRHLLRPGRA